MKFHRKALLMVALVLLAACGGGLDKRYLDVTMNKPLELPPDLSEFETRSSFDLPGTIAGEGQAEAGKVPVLAKVDSVKLESSADLYWLSVDETVEELYQAVKNFWSSEGYGLVTDEPIIGIMETEWIYTEEGGDQESDSWWASLFDSEDLSATQDQFRTRLERDGSGQGSRIYITHRGSEYVHEFQVGETDTEGEADTDNEWRHRESDSELEVEMLSRLMIYLGLHQDAVDGQVERVGLYSPRASLLVDADEKSPYLILKDPYHIAWNRVYHVIERLNLEIDNSEFKSGLSGEGAIYVKSKVIATKSDGGFFSLGTTQDETMRDFVLVLSEETHEFTRVIIENEKGEFDTSPEGAKFLELLLEQLN
ncbi:MAG: outer membrane protein assembly factor BamC [Gammaproteobacteria bacterium]|nr:outer membrane protein assembly factor BamC [Gammaproteobacteria bacterium]